MAEELSVNMWLRGFGSISFIRCKAQSTHCKYSSNQWLNVKVRHTVDCWIPSPGLHIGALHSICKVDLILFSQETALLLTALGRFMPFSPTQMKTLGAAPSLTPKPPRPTHMTSWEQPHFPAKVRAVPLTPHHISPLFNAPNGSAMLQERFQTLWW